jgi:predicted enzyme related to lactoylglutathione lyase
MVRPPFGSLRFLYVGSSDVGRDVEYYTGVLGAEKIWDLSSFGTRVAAVRVCDGPLILLAGHRPAPSCLPIFEVKDIDETAKKLKRKGWKSETGKFEIPNGPCYLFRDSSGNQLAIFQDVRPGMFEQGQGA